MRSDEARRRRRGVGTQWAESRERAGEGGKREWVTERVRERGGKRMGRGVGLGNGKWRNRKIHIQGEGDAPGHGSNG